MDDQSFIVVSKSADGSELRRMTVTAPSEADAMFIAEQQNRDIAKEHGGQVYAIESVVENGS